MTLVYCLEMHQTFVGNDNRVVSLHGCRMSDVLVGLNQKSSSAAAEPPRASSKSSKPLALNHENKENIIFGSPAISPTRELFIPSSQSSEMDVAEKVAGLQVGYDTINGHMAVTWRSHGGHMAVTWRSHGGCADSEMKHC